MWLVRIWLGWMRSCTSSFRLAVRRLLVVECGRRLGRQLARRVKLVVKAVDWETC